MGGLPLVKLREPGHAAGVQHPAMRPLGRALLLEGVEVATDGRLRNAQFPHEFFQRGEASNPNQVEKPAPTLVILNGNVLHGVMSMNE